MKGFCVLALATGLVLAAAGCGGAGSKHDVTGSVKFDGQPVADGDIAFYPENKSLAPEGGKIKDGKYSIKAPDGKSKVMITASRAISGKKGPMGEEFVEQYIPKKYNDESTLSVEVGSGKTTHDFDLK